MQFDFNFECILKMVGCNIKYTLCIVTDLTMQVKLHTKGVISQKAN